MDIIDIVSTVGFPIACCGALFYYLVNVQEKMRETIDANTRVLTKLTMIIGADEEEV